MLTKGSRVFRQDHLSLYGWSPEAPKKDEPPEPSPVDVPVLVYAPESAKFSWAKLGRVESAGNHVGLVEIKTQEGSVFKIHAAAKVHAHSMQARQGVRPMRLLRAVDGSPVDVFVVKVEEKGKPNGEGWKFSIVPERVVSVTPVRQPPKRPNERTGSDVTVPWYRAGIPDRTYLVVDGLLIR